ncbi:hypothetical protein HMPREF1207_03163 [Paenibacillus sp. HGH0039]|nr:hypothetical protein HMPREF1207_03163 [Paenibacillus sp. HGH0039]
MTDLYMILLLAVIYLIFYGFLTWCDHVVEGSEGGRT